MGISLRAGLAGARLRIEAPVMLASLSPGRLRAHPSSGRPLGFGTLGGPERKALWHVFPRWEESPGPPREGELPGVTFAGRDRDRVRVSRDVTRRCVVPGSEIEVDRCPSRICRPYKTTGFAPRVPYFASLPSHSQPSPLIA